MGPAKPGILFWHFPGLSESPGKRTQVLDSSGDQIKHDIKITMFQYKIIHNILATKMSLFRANFSDNDICPQCLAEAHSLDHMFLRCSSVVAY